MSLEITARDRSRLSSRGIAPEEVARQLELLRRKDRHVELVRPASIGDGIVRVDRPEVEELHRLHAEAAARGRCVKFVPASGAATRMFRELQRFRLEEERSPGWAEIRRRADSGDATAGCLVTFLDGIEAFAFRSDLVAALGPDADALRDLRAAGNFEAILSTLLSGEGLAFADRPKGRIPFHDYPDGARTPFEEHLREAAEYAIDGDGCCSVHFTVSPEHREGFAALFDAIAPRLREDVGATFTVTYSEQRPSTDTVATDLDGGPLRDGDGELVLRPGGHGALIENLDELSGDIVFVKNIDNVQPDHLRATTVEWKRTLAGWLVRLQSELHPILAALREGPEEGGDETIRAAERFVATRLMVEGSVAGEESASGRPDRRAAYLERLDRPMRVCGVVPNTGEPGGGPFWTRDAAGRETLQIVESAEIDDADDAQRAIFARATHFNPVDLVCGVRDERGRPYELRRFVDPETALVTTKSAEGRSIRVLERPGLWNGAMAGWNTVFVEVPLQTFSPVKSVLDLLRPEHQPPGSSGSGIAT